MCDVSKKLTAGCKNLFVCDASVFPTSSGVNPMMTVLAIADGIAEHIATSALAAAGRGTARL